MSFAFADNPGFGDLALEVTAESLEELFSEVATALYSSIVELENVSPSKSKDISLEAPTVEQLLYNWLEELILLKDTDLLVGKEIEISITKGKNVKLEATITGEKINSSKHELKHDVKAVTMHGFKVQKKRDGWHATVTFDL